MGETVGWLINFYKAVKIDIIFLLYDIINYNCEFSWFTHCHDFTNALKCPITWSYPILCCASPYRLFQGFSYTSINVIFSFLNV